MCTNECVAFLVEIMQSSHRVARRLCAGAAVRRRGMQLDTYNKHETPCYQLAARGFVAGAPSMGDNLVMKVHYALGSRRMLAESKGVYREVESKGSWMWKFESTTTGKVLSRRTEIS